MSMHQKINVFSRLIEDREVPLQYKDPQEFINLEERNEASDVYSFGMILFRILSGCDYFEYIGIPADEYFMTIDFSLSGSVIERKYIPDKYMDFSELLEGMTVIKREKRLSFSNVSQLINKLDHIYGTVPEETEYNDNKDYTNKSDIKFWMPESGYDYGIILNNKRIGRIEFRKLFDCISGSTGEFDIPVDESNNFRIAVSKRHSSNKNISNPSSVYGDSIVPVGILEANVGECNKVKIIFNAENENVNVAMYGLNLNDEDLYEIVQQQIRFTRVQ